MNLKEKENNDKNDESKKIKLSWRSRIKNEFSNRRKYNKHNLILKITISSLFLAIATGLSFIEFPISTPWGTQFYFRIIDTLILIFATGIVGLSFSMLIVITAQWLHFAFHGHNPIENLIFMASNMLIVFCLWLLYYFVFRLDVRKKCKVQQEGEQKEDNEHPHQFEKERWVKKILIVTLLVIIFALIESFAQISIAKVLLSTGHDHHEHDHHGHEHSHGVSGLFEGNNFWIGLGIFFGIFMAKYIVMFTVFISLEKQIKLITDRFQILV